MHGASPADGNILRAYPDSQAAAIAVDVRAQPLTVLCELAIVSPEYYHSISISYGTIMVDIDLPAEPP